MRFAKLSLERFGRFDGCELSFRSGAPDLHVIYGANEAGKTTSMAAVSDLLFGFEVRSPYNFAFGYPLLRVGAVLEEDGRSLTVRRRKANAATLVDADDKPIDEAPLIAMLHGQTRETFRAAFSLDHVRLRQGGRAIVEAKDDVGQALFAAGSGMTGITAALRALEDEAEAIWGPRAKKGRTYSQAASTYEVSSKAVRDQQVRPKLWSDARAALEQAEGEQRRLEGERQALLTEQRRVERLRRIGPAMGRRAELRALLDTKQAVVELAPAREERLLASLADAETAKRARQTAATLLAELEEIIARIPADPSILAQAERIDRLVERRGAIEEARGESVKLDAERKAKIDRWNELRRDIGLGEQDLPSRPLVARLRELVREHASASAELRTIGQAEAESAHRLRELERKIEVDAAPPELAELGAAVELARRLGDDIDERCAAAARSAMRAREEAELALRRLAPWSGFVDALKVLPLISSAEIDRADAYLAAARTQAREAAEAGQRAADELEELELRRTGLVERGHAVPKDDLLEAREARDAEWWDIQQHVRGAAQLDNPAAASDRFDHLLEQADALADRRFASAETSGQLALVDQQRTELTLRRAQSVERGRIVEARLQVELETWRGRLATAGLPGLEPARLRAWLIERDTALAAAASALKAEDAHDAENSRRAASRTALLSRLPDLAPVGDSLAPVLATASQRLKALEAVEQSRLDHVRDADQLRTTLANQQRQKQEARGTRDQVEMDWAIALAPAGLTLGFSDAEFRLALIDELRTVTSEALSLLTRLQTLQDDRTRFEEEITALRLAIEVDGATSLDTLRARLTEARASARTLEDRRTEVRQRQDEFDAAVAKRTAALDGLAATLKELGGITVEELDAAIQASRAVRAIREELASAEREIQAGGDGYALSELKRQCSGADPDGMADTASALSKQVADLNERVTAAASAAGEARRGFAAVDVSGADAAAAAADAQQARAEMAVQAEAFILKRAQAVTLRWAIERYREQHQDPLLAKASHLFRRLTLGRYAELRVDHESTSPRLLGLRDDGRTAIDVEAMSDGTADQLFLALRLAAAEQSVAKGVRMPFLADDLFINFDDDRSLAGFEVLAELATSTQVLFFTHHRHLAEIARDVVGADLHSECALV